MLLEAALNSKYIDTDTIVIYTYIQWQRVQQNV